ncbi:membrane or secreted protein [Candidatus Omnitrophus magneticus]|uniref:Membrane or secreted protein n=1 Tax=Candidatus Omnitrophus magneticus TaxID=1609969 RepID=A0A0F0CSN5_9BACT|nr:membrane or secreted protein [Candidatus Omnitrophus magneticus]
MSNHHSTISLSPLLLILAFFPPFLHSPALFSSFSLPLPPSTFHIFSK